MFFLLGLSASRCRGFVRPDFPISADFAVIDLMESVRPPVTDRGCGTVEEKS
jgi:hypothetical protein